MLLKRNAGEEQFSRWQPTRVAAQLGGWMRTPHKFWELAERRSGMETRTEEIEYRRRAIAHECSYLEREIKEATSRLNQLFKEDETLWEELQSIKSPSGGSQ